MERRKELEVLISHTITSITFKAEVYDRERKKISRINDGDADFCAEILNLSQQLDSLIKELNEINREFVAEEKIL